MLLLRTGTDKRLKVNLNGQTYKIRDAETDMIESFVTLINKGTKTIDDVPEVIKETVSIATNLET